MGYDATCTLLAEDRTFAVTARLEERALAIRGDVRLAIPLAIVDGVTARGGSLHFTAGGRAMALELGAAAEKWATRITNPPSRLEKLGVKGGMRVGLVGLDDPALVADLESGGATLERSDPRLVVGRGLAQLVDLDLQPLDPAVDPLDGQLGGVHIIHPLSPPTGGRRESSARSASAG